MNHGPDLFGKLLKDRYRLGASIGGGGFGWVYSGVDEELDRKVALKILQSHQGSYTEEQRQRFLQEARMTARLKSPTTVTLYDYGEYKEGERSFLFMVMEYIEGQTLDAWIKKHGPMPALDCVHVMIQILSSLSEAHANSFIHRDLKAPNVMIFKDGFQGALGIKVLDYGIAKAFTETKGWNHYTQTNSGLNLTPHYAAPEQLNPHAKIGPQTDLYTLGLVAYVCLIGKHPLDYMNDHMQVLTWLIGEEVCRLPKPDDKSPLAHIIHKLLLKNCDPKKGPIRYMSCDEVLADLKALETQVQRARRALLTDPQGLVRPSLEETVAAQPENSEPETLILANTVKEDDAYLLTQPAPDPELLYGFEDARTHVLKTPVPDLESEHALKAHAEITELVLPVSRLWHPAKVVAAALVCVGLGMSGVWVIAASKSNSAQADTPELSQDAALSGQSVAMPARPLVDPTLLKPLDLGQAQDPVGLKPDQSVELAHEHDLGNSQVEEVQTPTASRQTVKLKKVPKAVRAKSARRTSAKEEAVAPKLEPQDAPKATAKAQPPVEPKDEASKPPTAPKSVPSLKLEPKPAERKVWAVE